jgi:hypothetical protein
MNPAVFCTAPDIRGNHRRAVCCPARVCWRWCCWPGLPLLATGYYCARHLTAPRAGWPAVAAARGAMPKDGSSSGACMWGFVGAASFAALRGTWGLIAGSDDDARYALDMQRRLELKSIEDEFSFMSGVTRRCWSACIESGAEESGGEEVMPGGLMAVRLRSRPAPPRRQRGQRPPAAARQRPVFASHAAPRPPPHARRRRSAPRR